MSKKQVLDMGAMQEDFFSDTALVGIASTLPPYRFCWLLNQHFDINFVREPELDVCVHKGLDEKYYFSVYQYTAPSNACNYMLYKLKADKESLLPEVKQLDYLWMIQSQDPETDAQDIIQNLRDIADVQLAQSLQPDKLKNLNNLIN